MIIAEKAAWLIYDGYAAF